MAKKKTPNELRLRNSTAEFLTFAYQTGGDGVEVRVQDGTVWLSQKNIGALFETSSDNIGLHLKNIYKDGELSESATAEDFSVVQTEGARQVERVITHYNLDAIISVGYRVNSRQATSFRQWATGVTAIEQEMLGSLDNAQMEKLHDVLSRRLRGITVAEPTEEQADNPKYLLSFTSAKRVEGCSDKSLRYYESTLSNMLVGIGKPVKHITTDDLRQYLDKYQREGGAGKVTMDMGKTPH